MIIIKKATAPQDKDNEGEKNLKEEKRRKMQVEIPLQILFGLKALVTSALSGEPALSGEQR